MKISCFVLLCLLKKIPIESHRVKSILHVTFYFLKLIKTLLPHLGTNQSAQEVSVVFQAEENVHCPSML